jgi:hypothetical protein
VALGCDLDFKRFISLGSGRHFTLDPDTGSEPEVKKETEMTHLRIRKIRRLSRNKCW